MILRDDVNQRIPLKTVTLDDGTEALVVSSNNTVGDVINTPIVLNVTLTIDEESDIELTGDVRVIMMKSRDSDTSFRYAWASGDVGSSSPTGPYITVQGGLPYWIGGIRMTDPTLYLASSDTGVVVEIEYWTTGG